MPATAAPSAPQRHVICHLRPSSEASPAPYSGGTPAYEDPREPAPASRPEPAAAAAAEPGGGGAPLCQWCCHPFEGAPVGAPVRRAGEAYVVAGRFCTFPCAAAAIFGEHADSHAAWTRYQLLNDMRRDSVAAAPGAVLGPVVRAPPRSALRHFGGALSAAEFRARSADAAVVVRPPPMVVEQPRSEEIPARHVYRDLYVPIDEERVSRYKVRLRRSRNKDKASPMHSLHEYVGG